MLKILFLNEVMKIEDGLYLVRKKRYNETNYKWNQGEVIFMEFRKANVQDLEQIQTIYRQICKHMDENKIQIWDEVYPCQYLETDIANDELYALVDGGEILSALALCPTNDGAHAVKWMEDTDDAVYLNRLGVHVNHLQKGLGNLMLDKAKEQAKALGAQYLRLFVVDFNMPAVKLYVKNGFTKAQGIYEIMLEDGRVLQQYGYEVKV